MLQVAARTRPFVASKSQVHMLKAPNKKYFKRGDLAAKEEEEYWRKHKRLVVQEEPEKSSNSDSETSRKEDEEKEKVASLPRKEVVRRLRDRNEPILLFGETEYEAYQRLKKIEAAEPDIRHGEGFSNDFKAAMDQVDQDYYNEIMGGMSSEQRSKSDVSIKDDGTTVADIEEMQKSLGKEGSDKDQEIILKFLKLILKQWGESLNNRCEEEKLSMKGKFDSALHAQTVSYMKPLFKKLKNKKVQEDILECLVSIIGYLFERDYIKANDAYLEMAIGNAPWPIGVTMVGIHARTGREKISSRYVAHVLNDEAQRKYIQGLKRLMSQCQTLFPTDPSRSVNFEPIHH